MTTPLIPDPQLDPSTVDVANIRTQFIALISDYRNKADMIELAVAMLDGTLAPKYAELDAANAQVATLTKQLSDAQTQIQSLQSQLFQTTPPITPPIQ